MWWFRELLGSPKTTWTRHGSTSALILYKECWLRIVRLQSVKIKQSRALCTGADGKNGEEMDDAAKRREAYKQLENLDFMTATKIMLTVPPKRKKFGLDFHLVQLFFCCLPSLAVYLVAMYSRSEMRKMEAELELKRKIEEEAKAKEFARIAAEEKLKGPEAQILEVKERLEKLESAIQVIVVDAKKDNASNKRKDEASSSSSSEDTRNKDPKAADAKTLGDLTCTSQNVDNSPKADKPVLQEPSVDKNN